MTELALPDEPNETAPAVAEQPQNEAPTAGSSELVQWAHDARQAYAVAQSLANTSFAGQFKNKPEEITAVILAGQELGLKPMASLKSVDVIQGQPALRAHAMRAVVQTHGHEIELVESTDDKCVMRGRRKGAENWQTVEWTIERAQQLGLTGKDQWKKQPKTMLIARATGELSRLIAADALHGMPYVAEELEGTVHAEVVDTPAPKRRLSVAELTATDGQPGT